MLKSLRFETVSSHGIFTKSSIEVGVTSISVTLFAFT